MANIWAPPLALSNFNIITAVLGGFISLFGLVSYLLKDRFYMSEALLSLLAGVALGPPGADLVRPDAFVCSADASDKECRDSIDAITANFSRLVLGVQLVIAGIQLPDKYLWREWKPIAVLIGPGMTCMWLATSFLVWGLVGTPSLLHALAVGACVTPTDPVLSAVIVHGKFADKNVPKDLQRLIVAESGLNDGLGYPFLFFALYLIKYVGAAGKAHAVGDAFGLWFAFTWAYTVILSVLYGALVGWLAKELLYWAKKRNYVDRESFLVFAVSLALFVLGTCGLVGTDDILACFVAGNAFTWDDWFRAETKDDSLQPTVDMLLNVAIFLWYGAVVPWTQFHRNSVVSTWRLVVLGILVMLLRRLPWVFGLQKLIHQIKGKRQALFVGFFGPIGVSAIFYLFITLDFIDQHLSDANGVPRSDVKDLGETVRVVAWFLVVCSTVVHGLSIPLGKMGYTTPRTIYRVMSESLTTDNGWNSRLSSRLPSLSRFFSTSAADVRATEEQSRLPVLGKTSTGRPNPRLVVPVPPAVVRDAEAGTTDQEEEVPARRRREIRFYEEPEQRPST